MNAELILEELDLIGWNPSGDGFSDKGLVLDLLKRNVLVCELCSGRRIWC